MKLPRFGGVFDGFVDYGSVGRGLSTGQAAGRGRTVHIGRLLILSSRGRQDRRTGADTLGPAAADIPRNLLELSRLAGSLFVRRCNAAAARLCRTRREPEVYTPAFIVDGKLDAVGSDAAAVDHTLRQAALFQETAAQIDIQRTPAGLTISVGAGTGNGTLLLIGYDRLHRTHVGRGENSGRTLEEANIVRSMSVLGAWSGKAIHLQVPYPAGQEVAVILQRNDGPIVGAGVARAASSSS